ncbi:MAG: transcriptional regulator NrdR [Candidatus Improbicoccus devescovinae]|nr:MAG: transcriptional regulator NrdR [Candidatus Improbicoccus devescovinae]
MKCPNCLSENNKVVESRGTDDGERIRRRRECLDCTKRFTTYEVIENIPVIIIKKDGSREFFDYKKLFNGILKACQKRPISLDTIKNISKEIEAKIQNKLDVEVNSSIIGELAMNSLRKIDEVAYVRFASVYRQFKDVNDFMDDLKNLINK